MDDYTPREFENKLVGFEHIQKINQRGFWEMFRMLASTLITPHTKKGKGIHPQKLWPFDWDVKENAKPKMSKERLEYIIKRSKKIKDVKKGLR